MHPKSTHTLRSRNGAFAPDPTKSATDRFWSKVDKRAPHQCWPWLGYVAAHGYGVFNLARRLPVRVHRYAWELHNGPIPDGLFVCHHCDNKVCVNHRHLFLGTHNDNMADATRKGRMPINPRPGEENGRAILTAEQVAEIRTLGRSVSRQEIAERFGISIHYVSNLRMGIRWPQVIAAEVKRA